MQSLKKFITLYITFNTKLIIMTHKKLFAISTVLLMLFISFSCDKIKDEINDAAAFDVDMGLDDHYFSLDSLDFVSGKGVKGWQTLTQFEGYVNVDSIFSANNLSSASIENGTFTSVELNMTNPLPGLNFNFANQMRVTIATTADATGTEVASTGTIPANSTSLVFTVNSTNIASFVNNNYFYVKLEADVAGPIPAITLPLLLMSGIEFTVLPL